MRGVATFAVASTLTACAHASPQPEREEVFVACLADKQPSAIEKIRDADSEAAFLAALKDGAEICPIKVEGMSMGKLFRALNAYKQDDTDA